MSDHICSLSTGNILCRSLCTGYPTISVFALQVNLEGVLSFISIFAVLVKEAAFMIEGIFKFITFFSLTCLRWKRKTLVNNEAIICKFFDLPQQQKIVCNICSRFCVNVFTLLPTMGFLSIFKVMSTGC